MSLWNKTGRSLTSEACGESWRCHAVGGGAVSMRLALCSCSLFHTGRLCLAHATNLSASHAQMLCQGSELSHHAMLQLPNITKMQPRVAVKCPALNNLIPPPPHHQGDRLMINHTDHFTPL